jgi:hypothetical protein
MQYLAQNQFRWEKTEWVSFLTTFCILILYPLMNGYPILFADSWDYASGQCLSGLRSPVLACSMRPFIVFGGVWGYVVVQTAVTAFILVFLSGSILKQEYSNIYLISLLIASVGLFTGYLMADIWTLIGFICIFSISIGYSYFSIAIILALSYSVHHGNFPIFTTTAFFFLPFVRQKVKFSVIIVSSILGGILFILIANLLSAGSQLKIGTEVGSFTMPSSRILHDIPMVIEKKCKDDPGFKMCEIKEDILAWSGKGNPQKITWQGKKKLNIGWKELNNLSKEVFFYSLKGFFTKHISALVKNIYKLLFIYKISDGFYFYQHDDWPVKKLKLLFPEDVDKYEKSWQISGKLTHGLEKLEKPLSYIFRISMIVCLASIGFYRRNFREDVIVKFALFAVIAVIVNAFFMANLSGVYYRYHTRIGFLILFPAFIFIFRMIGRLNSRFLIGDKVLDLFTMKNNL